MSCLDVLYKFLLQWNFTEAIYSFYRDKVQFQIGKGILM